MIDVMPTIDKVIGSEDTPKRADCSIIALKVVGKDFKPLKKSKPKSAMFPSVDTKLSNSAKNILNILYVYVAL